jgi:hemerythrin superfamily protein
MPDPTTMLEQDHRKVEQLFEQYRSTQDPTVAEQICTELLVHTTIEEDVVYPVVKKDVPDGRELEAEAEKEHNEVEDLIKKVQRSGFDDPRVPNLIRQIEEGVTHHVEEEESEMFPKLRESLEGDRLERLGEKLAQAKEKELKRTAGTGHGSTVEGEVTKEELYQKAKELDIEGRSKMSKDELQGAVGGQ